MWETLPGQRQGNTSMVKGCMHASVHQESIWINNALMMLGAWWEESELINTESVEGILCLPIINHNNP